MNDLAFLALMLGLAPITMVVLCLYVSLGSGK